MLATENGFAIKCTLVKSLSFFYSSGYFENIVHVEQHAVFGEAQNLNKKRIH